MKNRSVPVDTVLPHIFCSDVAEALAWLTVTFGFTEHYRYGPPEKPEGAQIHLGNAWVMLTTVREGRGTPLETGTATQFVTVFVSDVDAHFERTKAAGAKIVEQLNETVYGERQYAAEDLNGHRWLFSQHSRDLNPTEWGAVVAES